MLATYMNHLDICKLMVETFLAQKQNKQITEYLNNLADGVIIFRNNQNYQNETKVNESINKQENFDAIFINTAMKNLFQLQDKDWD